MKLLDAVAGWLNRRNIRKNQTTWAFCPGCKHELTGDELSVVEDAQTTDGDKLVNPAAVRYWCLACGFKSKWDFDAPVPIYLGRWETGNPNETP